VPRSKKTVKLSLGAIGEACGFDRELTATMLKDLMLTFIHLNKLGRGLSLNLRVGRLQAYPNGEL